MVDINESLDKLEIYLLELEDKYIDIHTDPLENPEAYKLDVKVFVYFLMLLLKSS